MHPKVLHQRHLSYAGWLIAAIALALVAACGIASALAPNHYTFSQRDVQKAVERKFPYRKTAVQMFEVVLMNPVVELQPTRNRIAVRVDAQLTSPLMKQPLEGVFKISGQLAYDAASLSVRLIAPAVDTIELKGGARVYTEGIGAVAGLLLTGILDREVIYTFKPEQLRFAGANYEPGTIKILTDCVRVAIVKK